MFVHWAWDPGTISKYLINTQDFIIQNINYNVCLGSWSLNTVLCRAVHVPAGVAHTYWYCTYVHNSPPKRLPPTLNFLYWLPVAVLLRLRPQRRYPSIRGRIDHCLAIRCASHCTGNWRRSRLCNFIILLMGGGRNEGKLLDNYLVSR